MDVLIKLDVLGLSGRKGRPGRQLFSVSIREIETNEFRVGKKIVDAENR